MIDNLTTQQRMILAIALSFIFFVIYDLTMPKQSHVAQDQKVIKDISANSNSEINSTIMAPATTTAPATQTSAPVTTTNQAAPKSSNITNQTVLTTIKSKDFIATIDDLGRVSKFELLDNIYKNAKGIYPNLISSTKLPRPLEIRFSDHLLNKEAFEVKYTSDKKLIDLDSGAKKIVLTQKLSKTTLTKEITFFPDGNYKVNISLSQNFEYYISPGYRPNVEADMYTFHGALIKEFDKTLTLIDDGDAKGGEVYPRAYIAATMDRYFATAFYNFKDGMDVYISKDQNSNPLVFIKGAQNYSINGYIGPKAFDKLESIDKNLTDIIEYGWFTFLAKPIFLFLKYIYDIVGNWGWSIVIITVLIRLILYPLTYKGMVSMNKLKDLAPKIKELQKKYKGNPQKLNASMMELYKKHGANPMGGCLPMLIQIPIFFAIYRVLLNAVELKHAPWIGWIEDLSVADPYFILPILMGASMFWQQKITPTNFTDPIQEKIMKFLPLIFTLFFITFPAGLTLYWFVNNIFSVAQQYYVNSIFDKKKAQEKKAQEDNKKV